MLQKLRGHVGSLLKSIAEFAGVPMRATPRAAHFKAIVSCEHPIWGPCQCHHTCAYAPGPREKEQR